MKNMSRFMKPKKLLGLTSVILTLTMVFSITELTRSDATAGAAAVRAAGVIHTYPSHGYYNSDVASDATHVWAVDRGNWDYDIVGHVNEMNVSDGSLVQTIPVGNLPSAITLDGTHVWVFNGGIYGDWNNPTITELNESDGSLVRTISLRGMGVSGGGGGGASISSNGSDVWVDGGTNGGGGIGAGGLGGNAVHIDAATGAVVGHIFQPDGSGPLTINGSTLWIAYGGHFGPAHLQKCDASTGSILDTFDLTPLVNNHTALELRTRTTAVMSAVMAYGSHVWISHGRRWLAELNASDGSVVEDLDTVPELGSQADPPLRHIYTNGIYVWVGYEAMGTWGVGIVSEVSVATGALITNIQTYTSARFLSWDGNHLWALGPNALPLWEIDPGNAQVIALGTPPSVVGVGGPAYTPTTTGGGSSSPVIVTLDASSTGCAMTGGTVTFVSVGTCVIDANQDGDANMAPAPQVQQSISILLSPTQPTIANLPTNAALFGAFTASVSTDSNGVTSVASSTPSVCTVDSSNNVSFVGIGTCTLTSSVAQSAIYVAGSGMPQSFAVALATPTGPTISNIPTSTPVGQSFTPLVSTNSDGATSVASRTPRACTIDSGGVAHFIRHGLCTLRTSVTATASYQAQIGASQSFEVQIVPIIRWVKPLSIPYGTALSAAQLNAKSSVPGIFTYTPDFGTVLNGGVQALSANFTPTDTTNYVGGTVTTTIKVKAAWSHTELTVTNPTAAYGSESSTVFGVTVTGPAGAPIVGTVNVKVGWSSGCTITLSSSGTGTCSLGDGQLKRGNYAVMALFVRNGNQVGSHSTVTNIVITP